MTRTDSSYMFSGSNDSTGSTHRKIGYYFQNSEHFVVHFAQNRPIFQSRGLINAAQTKRINQETNKRFN